MGLANAAWWQARADARMNRYLWRGNETLQLISKAHQRAQSDIQAAIDRIYAKVEKEYGLTPDAAKQLLAQPADREEYVGLLRVVNDIQDPVQLQAVRARISSGAYSYRVSRLDALKDNIRVQTARLADAELSLTDAHLRSTITDAYSRNMFDLQRGTGYGFSFAQMNPRTVEHILANPWSGATFSKRIWTSSDKLADVLNEQLTAGIMTGKSNAQVSRTLADTMGVSYRNAERLVRTETNYVANTAELQSYREAEIRRYEFMATLDRRTSAICRKLDGQVFWVSQAKPGKNLPPMHPRCRSTTVAHFADEDLSKLERRARDPITGEDMIVPRSMKYEQWEKQYGNSAGNLSANIGKYLKAGANLPSIPRDVAAGVERSYRKIMRRWPQLQGEFQSLGTNERRPGVYASCHLGTGEVNVNPFYYQDKNTLKRSYDKDVAANWHPAGTGWESIVTHELGHAIDGYLTRNLQKIPGMPSAPQGRASTHIMNDVLKSLKKTPADISAGLSDYAASRPEEFFAESMAEYLDARRPRPMAKRAGKLVDQWMKEISKHP